MKVLHSIGLSDRINVLRNEKDQAQRLAIKNLEKADAIKDEFLANTSHEIRTPLNGILGIAESAQRHLANDNPLASDLGLISASGRRLLNLVNDILDIAKMNQGELKLYPSPVALSSAVDVVTRLMQPLCHDKGLRIVSDLDGSRVT